MYDVTIFTQQTPLSDINPSYQVRVRSAGEMQVRSEFSEEYCSVLLGGNGALVSPRSTTFKIVSECLSGGNQTSWSFLKTCHLSCTRPLQF